MNKIQTAALEQSDEMQQGGLRRELFFALVLSLAVFLVAPQQLPVSLYKLNLIALAAVAGYWIDRSVFPYARPQVSALRALTPLPDIEVTEDENQRGVVKLDDGLEVPLECFAQQACGHVDPVPIHFVAACMLRRALIMAAAIIAVSLGA